MRPCGMLAARRAGAKYFSPLFGFAHIAAPTHDEGVAGEPMQRRTKIVAGGGGAGAGALPLAARPGLTPGRAPAKSGAKAAPSVTVTTPQLRDLPIELTAQGHLVALNQVDVRPQIAGVIRSVDFHEGDAIHAGQLLFTLDDTEWVSQLRHAEANAAQVKAQLDDAVRAQDRAADLLKETFISQSALDTAISKADSLKAQLKAANADIDNAHVQLARTRIASPLSGKAGAPNVHPARPAPPARPLSLVSLAQFDPIGVEFSLPEANLAVVLAARAVAPVKVPRQTPDRPPVEGELSFINNTVSTGTGTINLKATFPNREQALWPGAYVKTTVSAGVNKGAMVLPPHAILEGPAGRFAYVLDAGNKVAGKPVTLPPRPDQEAVIRGLQRRRGARLAGNQNVSPGAVVQIAPKAAVASTP